MVQKKVLLCTGRLECWSGSEVVIFEMAQEFSKQNFQVDIFTYYARKEIKEYFSTYGFSITHHREIDLLNYDVIYTQQNSLSALLNETQIINMCQKGFPVLYMHICHLLLTLKHH